MKVWMKPQVVQYDLSMISNEIKAKAWSVESSMNYYGYIDAANKGDFGSIPMEGNYGHTIQVECIGWIFLGIKAFRDSLGNLYCFSKNNNGSWSRVYL